MTTTSLPTPRHAVDAVVNTLAPITLMDRLQRRAYWLVPTALIAAWPASSSPIPTLWYDEAATVSSSTRSYADLLHLLGNVDAVHGAYYAIMHTWTLVFGSSPASFRAFSILAVTLMTAGVAVTGARVADKLTGFAAGMVCAILPITTAYALEARGYAFAAALAAWASYALVRAVDDGGRWWICYGLLMVALGIVFLFGILVAAAHLVTILLTRRRALARWGVIIIGVAMAIWPLFIEFQSQKGQVGWLPKLTLADLQKIPAGTWFENSSGVAAIVWFLIAIGIFLRFQDPARYGDKAGRVGIIALGVPWIVLPLAILVSTSFVMPVYTARYVLVSVPALALVTGYAIARLCRLIGGPQMSFVLAGCLAAIAVAGAPIQTRLRSDDGGKYNNLREIGAFVADRAQPGDALMFNPGWWRIAVDAYPASYRLTPEVTMGKTPEAAGNLEGKPAAPQVINERMKAVQRVWVITPRGGPSADQLVFLKGWKQVNRPWVGGIQVMLYVRPEARPRR